MSGLETLPPDQRAVLQLILVQGRGYAELATTLRLDAVAVRERALAAAQALGAHAGGEPDADARGRIVDYLLGQQDEGERIVTFAELGDSPAACRWAQELRAQLAPVAREELPEVPATAALAVAGGGGAPNGTAATAVAPAPAEPAPSPSVAAPPPPAPPAPPRAAGRAPTGPAGPRPSRLGGALLIAGAAVLAIVLAIVLIGGGSGKPAATTAAGTQTGTTPARSSGGSGTTSTTGTTASRSPSARLIGQALLRPPAGGAATGGALVEQISDGRRAIAVVATRLAPNGSQDIYAIWLQGAAGSRFLGFVPRRVGSSGQFTVSASLDRTIDLSAYPTVLVTREGTAATPTTTGTTVLGGPLRLTG